MYYSKNNRLDTESNIFFVLNVFFLYGDFFVFEYYALCYRAWHAENGTLQKDLTSTGKASCPISLAMKTWKNESRH